MEFEKESNIHLILKCPHCEDFVLIDKLNCGIFRHGIIIHSGNQMNPHETKENCDKLKNQNLIYGCGKPFKIVLNHKGEINGNMYFIEKCDYI
jgi:hypothetical protein